MSNGQNFEKIERERKARRTVFYLTFSALTSVIDTSVMTVVTPTIAHAFHASLEAVESSLYAALERAGNRPVRALKRLRAVLFTAEQAELLKAQEKDPGLLVERLGFLTDGRTAEFTQSYYRGDIYDFVAELSIAT